MSIAIEKNGTTFKEAYRLHQAGDMDGAARMYRQILQGNPDHVQALQLLGVVRIQQRAFRDAVRLIRRALRLQPDAPVFHHNLGSALYVLGEFADAEHHYRRALEIKPDYAEAYFNLSSVRRFAEDDPLIPLLEDRLQRGDLSQEDRCFLHFAAGKIYNDLGWRDRAFEQYRQGNAARELEFDPENHARFVDRVIESFGEAQLAPLAGHGCDDDTPILVIGMPRSGTTLVEQILASHDEVYGAGELPDIASIANTLPRHASSGQPFPDCVPSLPVEVFRGFGKSYLRRLRTINDAARHIVDKSPLNFFYLGLIQLMLPGARVIHCRRNPLDTCLSCYFQRFRSGQEFSYDLDHLGSFYRAYERLMDHWREVLTIRFFDLQYESLVENPQHVCHELIEFCGLPWNEDCLQFHKHSREVTTASSWQVRRPIYRSSAGRWRAYDRYLGPLKRSLQIA